MTDVTSATSRTPVELDEDGARTWNAMQSGIGAWFELPDWHWMTFSGDKTVDVLNGLVTNDVSMLRDGDVQFAAALTAKGKLVADLFIYRESATSFLTGTRMPAYAGWAQVVRKFVNPRLAMYRDEQESLTTFLVAGAAASALRVESRRMRIPMLGSIAAELIVVPREMREAVREQLRDLHGREGHQDALEVARIAAGWPRWGVEMDDNTLVQEANLEQLGAVSFEKGCYTGQETVARVHFRGHVNRHLRHLESAQPVNPGSTVRDAEGKEVGDVRSSAVVPGKGALAVAMVRREVAPGDTVAIEPNGKPEVAHATPSVSAVVRAISPLA